MNYLSNATLELLIYFNCENNDGIFKLNHFQNSEIVQLIEELIDNKISENFVFDRIFPLDGNHTNYLVDYYLKLKFGSNANFIHTCLNPYEFLIDSPQKIEFFKNKYTLLAQNWDIYKNFLYIKIQNSHDQNTKNFITKYLIAFIKDSLKSNSDQTKKFNDSLNATKKLLLKNTALNFPFKINVNHASDTRILESLLYFESKQFISFINTSFNKNKKFQIIIHQNKKIQEWQHLLQYHNLTLDTTEFTLKESSYIPRKLRHGLFLFIKHFFANPTIKHDMKHLLEEQLKEEYNEKKIINSDMISLKNLKDQANDIFKELSIKAKKVPFIRQKKNKNNNQTEYFLTTRSKDEINKYNKKKK